MKRVVSLIITFLIVSSFLSVSASAYVPEWIADKGYLYADRFFKNWSKEGIDDALEAHAYIEYKELYYHRDETDTIDWVLVRGCANMTPPVPSEVHSKFGRYYLVNGDLEYTFLGGIGIYDVKKDQFFDISNDPFWGTSLNYVDYREYDGFIEALESVDWSSEDVYFARVGDLDIDNEVTILDATLLQRWLAELAYPPITTVGPEARADFDDDGDITVLDATAIQAYLLDN